MKRTRQQSEAGSSPVKRRRAVSPVTDECESAARESFAQLREELAQTRTACFDLIATSRAQRATLDAALSRAMRKWFNPQKRPTVLVVDDEAEIRELAAELLSGAGFDTTVAVHGRQALELCAAARRPFDLILTDAHMPEVDGQELSRRLRQCSPQSAVVVMTGMPNSPELRQWVSELRLPLIAKPFTPALLTWTVRSNLERSDRCDLPPALIA